VEVRGDVRPFVLAYPRPPFGIESPQRFYHEIDDMKGYGEDIPKELFSNGYSRDEIVAKGWRKGCAVPWVHIIVGANGEVHPCCISPTALGNINDNTIEEIWFGPKYQAFRKMLKSSRPHRDCFNCRRAIWKSERSPRCASTARNWPMCGWYFTSMRKSLVPPLPPGPLSPEGFTQKSGEKSSRPTRSPEAGERR
jgi:radical SAM protein with 4Fe4S-binding SPASM domain